MDEQFQSFVQESEEKFQIAAQLLEIDKFMSDHDCKREVSTAKNGYVISYELKSTKRKLANLVTRKSGIKIRIYAENVAEYEGILNEAPDKMKKEIHKAPACKRLLDPNACNSRCPQGYQFVLDGEEFKKCRYSAFMPTVNGENETFIIKFLENELNMRLA